MVRNVDHDARRRAVLTATVQRYINNALPVSSDDIASEFELSPATIRNIFSELEEGQYLTHPHTSAGRMPTDKGYRYYVDLLLSQMRLLDKEKEKILRGYKKEIRKLEDTLQYTTEVLSAITHYTAIISLLESHDLFYRGLSFVLEQPEFRDSTRIRLLIKIIEDKERLVDIINRDFSDKVKVYIGDELGFGEMNDCALVVSGYSSKRKPFGRIAILGPTRMQYSHIIPTLEYVSEILSDALEDI